MAVGKRELEQELPDRNVMVGFLMSFAGAHFVPVLATAQTSAGRRHGRHTTGLNVRWMFSLGERHVVVI